MNSIDLENASYYYELYIFGYLLENEYITEEEYARITHRCKADNGIFIVS